MPPPRTMTPRTITMRAGKVSLRLRSRAIIVGTLFLLVLLATAGLSLSLGTFSLSPQELVDTLLGQGTNAAQKIVLEWRAPRVVIAAVFGAALALSGAVFQSLTRNPLGSPDIVGFSVGSFTGVLLVFLAGGAGFFATAGGALVGGLITTLAIYAIAFRRGVQGFRLIVVGIAVSSMLTSVNTWISVKADVDTALRAAVWGAGTLNGIRWQEALPGVVAVAILMLLLVLQAPRLRELELGDDTAAMLGTRVELAKLKLIVIAVGLIAVVTAIAGPIAFVALAAPQIARRLTRAGSVDLVGSALVGATLLTASDLVALHAVGDKPVPVGVVTVCVGGIYLLWLLYREARRR